MSWFFGAGAAAQPRIEKYFLVNYRNETPYGYFLHRETGGESSYDMSPTDRKDIETFKKYLSQSEIDEHNAKNPRDEKYKYAIEPPPPPPDRYNLFKMTGEPNPPSFPIITYKELLDHYGPNAVRPKHRGRGGKVRKSRRMDRKSRKGKKPIFTH